MMELADEYFTIQQAAKYIGVTRQTISRWVKNGLPSEKVGREILIRKSDIKLTVCPTCGARRYNIRGDKQ